MHSILEANPKKRTPKERKEEKELIQRYRLAGLLHDIGHYPFSHATEHALKSINKSSELEEMTAEASETTPRFHSHERVGKRILLHDKAIRAALDSDGIKPDSISRIFAGEESNALVNILSSDLDVDRIDYLLRTSHGSGLPYGSVDVNYLVSQMRLDGKNRPCLTQKALRAAEHLLLARYFDYRQIVFHKAVVGFELALKQALKDLVEKEVLTLSANDVEAKIKNGEWATVDDGSVMECIRTLAKEEGEAASVVFAQCVAARTPPILVYEKEWLGSRDKNTGQFKAAKRDVAGLKERIEKEGFAGERLLPWDKSFALTKAGTSIPLGTPNGNGKERTGESQAIRILGENGESKAIMCESRSLMSVLGDNKYFAVRLYLFPTEAERADSARMAKIKRIGLKWDSRD